MTTDSARVGELGDDPKNAAAPYREVTAPSLWLGIIIGVALTVSFTYAGLKLGFTVPASMVAAMLGWGILRKGLGTGSIVENNINQTVAAAINVSAAGVIFTVPVLYLLSSDAAINSPEVIAAAQAAGITVEKYVATHPELQLISSRMLWSMAAAATAGSMLGVLFIIPSRKQMIDLERLVFPSGVATAAILKASGSGPVRFRWLMIGIAFAITFALVTGIKSIFPDLPLLSEIPDDFDLGHKLGFPMHFAIVIAVLGGLTSLGGGYITGRAGLVLMVGAVLAHWIVTPLVVTRGWMPAEVIADLTSKAKGVKDEFDAMASGWSYKYAARPLGVGMLLGGSIASVVLTAPMLLSAIKSIQKQRSAAQAAKDQGAQITQELPPKLIWVSSGISFVVLFLAGWFGSEGASLWRVLVAAVVATVWMWLANIIVSIATGKTDNSPLSGMALITIVLVVTLLGREGAMVALVMAVAVCVATGQGSDMMQDLKTGHLVGAIPRRQQITQFAVAWIGPLISLLTLVLLAKKFVFGNDPLTAPQGQAIKAALELFAPQAVLNDQQLAIAAAVKLRYVVGTVAGLLLTLGLGGGLGVVIGLAMYLPMSVTLTYCIGCALTVVTEKWRGRGWVDDIGIPLAAGFLVGEGLAQVALVGVDLARTALG
ncbi:MAG: OPT/YSL family transporter [Deltaproteobacteria bacterium]|nr:OPT/YSL family transporter [Deltaproteobacteria bacterium]